VTLAAASTRHGSLSTKSNYKPLLARDGSTARSNEPVARRSLSSVAALNPWAPRGPPTSDFVGTFRPPGQRCAAPPDVTATGEGRDGLAQLLRPPGPPQNCQWVWRELFYRQPSRGAVHAHSPDDPKDAVREAHPISRRRNRSAWHHDDVWRRIGSARAKTGQIRRVRRARSGLTLAV
jgi:hypothetical protein